MSGRRRGDIFFCQHSSTQLKRTLLNSLFVTKLKDVALNHSYTSLKCIRVNLRGQLLMHLVIPVCIVRLTVEKEVGRLVLKDSYVDKDKGGGLASQLSTCMPYLLTNSSMGSE